MRVAGNCKSGRLELGHLINKNNGTTNCRFCFGFCNDTTVQIPIGMMNTRVHRSDKDNRKIPAFRLAIRLHLAELYQRQLTFATGAEDP